MLDDELLYKEKYEKYKKKYLDLKTGGDKSAEKKQIMEIKNKYTLLKQIYNFGYEKDKYIYI